MTYEELRKALDFVSEEKQKLLNENELLKEEIKELRHAINNCYDTMYSLRVISDYEEKKQEEIEEL